MGLAHCRYPTAGGAGLQVSQASFLLTAMREDSTKACVWYVFFTPGTDSRFPLLNLDISRQIDNLFPMLCCYLAHLVGWDRHNLHDLQQ